VSAVHPGGAFGAPAHQSQQRQAPHATAWRLPLAAAIVVAALLALSHPLGQWLKPTQRTSELHGAIDLESQVPRTFGEWRLDPSIRPVLPDPSVQATLDALYSQVLARTYVNNAGQRVMLSIAYGDDQSSEATAVHRPEFCYRGQGFAVTEGTVDSVALPTHRLAVQRLHAHLGPRQEPISYWITLDRSATLPGWGRKWSQLQYGMRGQIADGMVMRVSTLGTDATAAHTLHDRFIGQLHAAMPEALKARYFGR
jgi:EpsI family protein